MNNNDSARSNARHDVPLIQIPSAVRFRDDRRHPIKHVLIGSPRAIEITHNTLHVLKYADVGDWAQPLLINEAFTITPDLGDAISVLVRYLPLE